MYINKCTYFLGFNVFNKIYKRHRQVLCTFFYKVTVKPYIRMRDSK